MPARIVREQMPDRCDSGQIVRDMMRYSELIQLYFERSTALQSYWTLYVVVVGGLLAFSSLRTRPDATTGVLITVLFCCFAYKNLSAIHDATLQRAAILQAIQQIPVVTDPAAGVMNSTLVAPAYEGIRDFHVASDLLTIAALWAMELRRRRTTASATAK